MVEGRQRRRVVGNLEVAFGRGEKGGKEAKMDVAVDIGGGGDDGDGGSFVLGYLLRCFRS